MTAGVEKQAIAPHLKRLFKSARSETERSVQFNLLPLETAHHGKCTLGNGDEAIRKPSSKGGLAQLVERLLCKQNVNGSNPLTSTTGS
jgi:hypothetical protein